MMPLFFVRGNEYDTVKNAEDREMIDATTKVH